MEAAGVPEPPILVTAIDVRRGKPAPDAYLQAAAGLGFPPASCLVIEDAPAGVTAGKAAGMQVIAVAGTAPREALAAADYYLDALDRLRLVSVSPEGLTLAFNGG
jgi:sugar-phosphatase